MFKKLKDMKIGLSTAIKQTFDKERLIELARKTGFVKRSTSRLQGDELIEVLTVDMLDDPEISYESMCERIAELNPDAEIKPQSLAERITKQETVDYIKAVIEEAMNKNLSPVDNILPDLLGHFSNVDVRDSTVVCLNEKLAPEFKGSGGSASSSALKVNFVYSLKYRKVVKLTVHEATEPEQSLCSDGTHELKAGDLEIVDLGYFVLKEFDRLDKSGIFYLSRLLTSVNVYLSEEDSEPVNLPGYLNENFTNQPVVDLMVFIGKEERVPVRLISYRLKQEIVSERRRKARKNAKKKGRTPTECHMAMLEFSFFITNVPVEVWKPEVVGTLYRVRWHIELMFKCWKSLLNIDILKGTRRERIECIIYARILSIILITNICSYAAAYAWHTYKKEISYHKVISWLLRQFRFHMVATNPEKILSDIESSISRLCKQSRKRKTTLELIDAGIGYLETLDEKIRPCANGAAENVV